MERLSMKAKIWISLLAVALPVALLATASTWTGTGVSVYGVSGNGQPVELTATDAGVLNVNVIAGSTVTGTVTIDNVTATAVPVNPVADQNAVSTFRLVSASDSNGTLMPATALSGRRALEIQAIEANLWCSLNVAPVVNKARKIVTGDAWALDCGSVACGNTRCIASSADANAVVTEVK